MLKKLMSKNLNILTYFSSGISIISLIISIGDTKLKDRYLKLQETKELLEKQVNELKIDELKNEVTKTKVEYYRTSLEESQNKLTNELESIEQLVNKNNDQKEILSSHLDNLNKENDNMQNMISDILKYFKDNDNNKFIGDNNNIIEFFTNYIENFNKFLSTLSFEQLIAVAHLTSTICILINIFTIISILFGDQLINYFKLEERFPRLAFIFNLRKKFNNFSLILSFIMIISILIALIYVNSLILINF